MANHKSAKKRARSSDVKRLRNRQYLSAVRTSVKKFRVALTEGQDNETVQNLFKAAQSMLAKAATKGLLHKNNATRSIGRLAGAIKAKAATTADTTKAAPKKRPAAKKTAKTAAKKKAAAPKTRKSTPAKKSK